MIGSKPWNDPINALHNPCLQATHTGATSLEKAHVAHWNDIPLGAACPGYAPGSRAAGAGGQQGTAAAKASLAPASSC